MTPSQTAIEAAERIVGNTDFLLNTPKLRSEWASEIAAIIQSAIDAEVKPLLLRLEAIEVFTRGTFSTHVHQIAADALEEAALTNTERKKRR